MFLHISSQENYCKICVAPLRDTYDFVSPRVFTLMQEPVSSPGAVSPKTILLLKPRGFHCICRCLAASSDVAIIEA